MTREQGLLDGVRELLWAGLCWNDHNFREGTLAKKCRRICADLDITDVDQANAILDDMAKKLTVLERK